MSPMPPLPTTAPLVCLGEDSEHSDSSYDEQSSKKQKYLCIITLDGDELSFIVNDKQEFTALVKFLLPNCSFIVNGKKDDPIELLPFDSTFTKERI